MPQLVGIITTQIHKNIFVISG